jgi:hypothetical protein
MYRNFAEGLAEELDSLAAACRRYDEGRTHGYRHIATILRKLFHDTRTCTSLVTHLRISTLVDLLLDRGHSAAECVVLSRDNQRGDSHRYCR